MGASPMRTLRRRRPKLYWAERQRFMWPGVFMWIGHRRVRVVPMPATRWTRECRRRQHPSRMARLRLWVMPE